MNHYRIGVDIDGVVASWNTQFVALIKERCGIVVDTTPPWPTQWNWPKLVLSNKALNGLWDWIKANSWWWRMLLPTDTGVEDMRLLEKLHQEGHVVVFITSRPTTEVQRQTAVWLTGNGMLYPSVLLAKGPKEKALLCQGLQLDVMIDDKPANVEACRAAGTRTFLRRQPYNREMIGGDQAGSVTDMWNQIQAEQMGKVA